MKQGKKLLKGVKYDSGKLEWDKFLWPEAEDIMKVIQFGANKYDWNNFEKVSDGKNRYIAALIRHILSYSCGEVNDSETGLSHLAHAGCNILFLLRLENNKKRPAPVISRDRPQVVKGRKGL